MSQVRKSSRRLFLFAAFLVIGVIGYATYGFLYACPCGFKYDFLTRGCSVILGPVRCPNTVERRFETKTGNPGKEPAKVVVPPGSFPSTPYSSRTCSYNITNCWLSRETSTLHYAVVSNSGVTELGWFGPFIELELMQDGCLSMITRLVTFGPNTGDHERRIDNLCLRGKVHVQMSPIELSPSAHPRPECGCKILLR
jgi:hypothetical protein